MGIVLQRLLSHILIMRRVLLFLIMGNSKTQDGYLAKLINEDRQIALQKESLKLGIH